VKDIDLKKIVIREVQKDVVIVMSTCFTKNYIVLVVVLNLEQKENQNYTKNYSPSIVFMKTSMG